jgi:hypothetical protein
MSDEWAKGFAAGLHVSANVKSTIDPYLLEVVLDTYNDEGVGIWCRNWHKANATKRVAMRGALMHDA